MKAEGVRDRALHALTIREDLGRLSDQCAVDIHNFGILFFCESPALLQNLEARNSLDGGVSRRKIIADIWKAKSSKQCICDSVRKDVSIGVALKAMRMGNSYTSKNQGSIRSKLVDVISNANTVHDLEGSDRVRKGASPSWAQFLCSPSQTETGSKGETGPKASFVL